MQEDIKKERQTVAPFFYVWGKRNKVNYTGCWNKIAMPSLPMAK